MMVKKCFVLHEEFIDLFHDTFYIPTIEKMSFHIAHVSNFGSMESGKTRNICFHDNASKNNIKLNKYYAEKFSEKTV